SSTKLDIDAIGRVRKQIGAQDAKDGLEYGNGHQTDHQYVERAHAAMHKHLVDHNLEEQRRYQGEELQEKGGNEYLAEVAPILVNRPEEPGDIEAPRHVGQCGAPCYQDNTAVSDRLELSLGH